MIPNEESQMLKPILVENKESTNIPFQRRTQTSKLEVLNLTRFLLDNRDGHKKERKDALPGKIVIEKLNLHYPL